ncbi:MAG: hypothetical protein QM706_19675 [Nitrospira sp.]
MLHTWVVFPNCSGLVHVTDQPQSSTSHRSSKILSWLVVVVLCLLSSIGQAWGEIRTQEKRAIVAAGFGYQIGTVSTIAVKVYDAESGDTLSDEVYELAVKESDGAVSNRGPRIFAGGVGLGATDLTDFVLRVYDANTGVFQWEGRLNLMQPDRKTWGQVVSATPLRRATVMKIQVADATMEQPVFLLRAMDAVTGMLVWEDEFTTVGMRIARAHQIAGQSAQSDSLSLARPHTFNFKIRMYDSSGRKVLWEDQLAQQEPNEGPEQSHRDQADILPAWPHLPEEEPAAGSI